MRFFLLGAALAALLLAACGGGGEQQPTVSVSPSPAVIRPSPTPEPTPTAVPRPDPQTLLQPGYVLDQALEVNLDGSEMGQIVVVSHTNRQGLLCAGQALDPKTGTPLPTPQTGCDETTLTAAPSKESCSQDTLEVDPSVCFFQVEIVAYDEASGWTSRYISKNHRSGVQEIGEAKVFRLDQSREVLVLAFHYCTGIGSGCGWVHEVLTMQRDEVKSAYQTWQAQFTLEADRLTFDNPALFRDDAFCCPSGRRVETLALDPSTGELGVIESELLLCTDGTLVHDAGALYPPQLLEIRCETGQPGSLFQTVGGTAVAPAAIGGTQGLREGHRVRVEYATECEGETSFCSLVATKITVLNP